MKLKKQDPAIVKSDVPHYFEVRFENHPNGLKKVHCGTQRDLETILEMYPGSKWEKIYLPHPPQTVDVPHISVAPDLELPMQQILPESELQPVDLK